MPPWHDPIISVIDRDMPPGDRIRNDLEVSTLLHLMDLDGDTRPRTITLTFLPNDNVITIERA